jgi:signal transduction histidine kinase
MAAFNALRILLTAVCLAALPAAAFAAGDHATADDAKAMVEKAVALIKQAGPEKAFAAIDDKSNKEFHDRDLYVYVRTFDGNTVAHGANMGLIGHTNLDFNDADGKPYVKEMVDKAKSGQNSGWVDYRFPDPLTHKIEQKSTYYQREGDYLVCAGVYKS